MGSHCIGPLLSLETTLKNTLTTEIKLSENFDTVLHVRFKAGTKAGVGLKFDNLLFSVDNKCAVPQGGTPKKNG